MIDIDWTIVAAIAFAAFMMGRLSKPRRVKLTPAQLKLEKTPLDDMTNEQYNLYESYRTMQALMDSKSITDPTWQAFLMTTHDELYMPLNVTWDHLMGGKDPKKVLELIAEAFCAADQAVATV